MTYAAIEEFICAMRNKGCAPDGRSRIVADDAWRRYTVVGDPPTKRNGSYKLNILNGVAMGFFCNHKEGVTHKFISGDKKLGDLEAKAFHAMLKKQKQERQRQQDKEYEAVGLQCREIFYNSPKAGRSHPYLERKKIGPHNLRQNGSCLLIPIMDVTGKIWTIGKIWPNGKKLFEKGGKIAGNFYPVYKNENREKIIIAEGVATGIALHEATGLTVVCALAANNLPNVAKNIKKKYPESVIIIAADNDIFTKKEGQPFNPGIEYATKAAEVCSGAVVFPVFTDGSKKFTDFQEFRELYGDCKVRECFR